jgi:hypothetical protein
MITVITLTFTVTVTFAVTRIHVTIAGLAFVCARGRAFDADSRAFPQSVVEAGYAGLGVVRVVHVDEAEVF